MTCRCNICPNCCSIDDGDFGICGVRSCKQGEIYLPYYGRLSAVSNDPVEKKPLYHFFPGSSIFSVGFYGCSLSCPFCQNHRISKDFPAPPAQSVSPDQLVNLALDSRATAVAYTYSEPIVHFEWIIETCAAARKAGLKNVLVTNGYINKKPGRLLLEHVDAANVDLKSFSDEFYKKELHGRLAPVLEFIETASETVHTEVTTLIIPGKNDTDEEIREAAGFIADIDRNIPYHLSAYYPAFKYTIPPTQPGHLKKLAESASEYLNFVFTGNISGGRSDSLCPECGNLLIRRSGYSVNTSGIEKSCCTKCGFNVENCGIVLR